MWPYVTKSCPIEHEWKCVKFPWTLLSLSPLRAYFRYEDNILNDYTMRVVQALSCVRLFVTPCHSQTSLSFTISWSLLKLMSIGSVMPFNYIILCRLLLLLASIFPSIRVFSSELALCTRWSKYWSFSFSISPSNEIFRVDFLKDWLVWSWCSSKDS